MNKIDFTQYWRHPGLHDLCLLKARFTRHRYELHTHPTYVVALITGGCERLRIGSRQTAAAAGSVLIVHPEECHDGEAGADVGWSYRTLYPTVPLMTNIARELGRAGPPVFGAPVIDDPLAARLIANAHVIAETDDGEAAGACMLAALRYLILHHADASRGAEPIERSGARRRFAMYVAAMEPAMELQRLADVAGVTRFQVIRDFKHVTGLTPGAWLRNRRLRLASQMIEQGATVADAAFATGFADQSHLSRSFRSIHGITPAMFRRACRHEQERAA